MSILNLLALFLLGALTYLARRLCRCPAAQIEKILRLLCRLLLGVNLARYLIVYPAFFFQVRIPAEFSTSAYFVVSLIVLAGWKKLYCWAAYSGLMAGFFYYLAMILAGGAIYGGNTPLDNAVCLFCHGTLYFCGFVLVSTTSFSRHDGWKLLLGTGYIGLRAAMPRPLVLGRSTMLIYILLDAIPARTIFPDAATWPTVVPIYYGLLAAFVFCTICGFFRRNRKQCRKYAAPLPAAG